MANGAEKIIEPEKIDNPLVEKGRAFEKKSYEKAGGIGAGEKENRSQNAIADRALSARSPAHRIEELFLKRWSPRALEPTAITKADLESLLEAARWAPSTYNEQEWRFLYAHRESVEWPLFFDALTEQNQAWCRNAGTLICICGKKAMTKTGKMNPVRSFDCGAAFQNMALQGAAMGVVVHGMAGFSEDKLRANLEIPDEFAVEAMAALGYPGDPEKLPPQLKEAEAPSLRKPLPQIMAQGKFAFDS